LRQFSKVVGFPIINKTVAGVGIVHRLVTGARGIDDRESCVSKRNCAALKLPTPNALIVRAAMRLRSVHAQHHFAIQQTSRQQP
jgi:hypothetical protein